eukprot:CAMPEP_0172616878 /NCGR_PEP_ID=MMETSP1068-20121228/68528_1 /TAXON_ID=35684 /ORGANISM="Pseudopedinella elastica, Strain CCMP716" /LENGTH=152 /DNA_ID=CAMNT_0013422483 /DNA_START=44 /DNA_END=502 /DNA_ORIENTATION=-
MSMITTTHRRDSERHRDEAMAHEDQSRYPRIVGDERISSYPNVIPPPPSIIQQYVAAQSDDLEYNPSRACMRSASFSLAFGLSMASARGLWLAAMMPPRQRLAGFFLSLPAIAPVYCIPMLVGSQLDCYTAVQERKTREFRQYDRHGAADMA